MTTEINMAHRRCFKPFSEHLLSLGSRLFKSIDTKYFVWVLDSLYLCIELQYIQNTMHTNAIIINNIKQSYGVGLSNCPRLSRSCYMSIFLNYYNYYNIVILHACSVTNKQIQILFLS